MRIVKARRVKVGRPALTGTRAGRPSAWDRGSQNGYQRAKLTALVMQRDRWTCQYCGGPATQIDHRKPRRLGGTDELDNLCACCTECQHAPDRSSTALYGAQGPRSVRVGLARVGRSFRDGGEKHLVFPQKDPRKKPSQGDPSPTEPFNDPIPLVKRDYSASIHRKAVNEG